MMKDEALARDYAAPYLNRSELWSVLVAPSDGFRPLLALELGGDPHAWFAADALCLDVQRFGRASFHGVTVRAFDTWSVAVWMRPIDFEVGP
jgi:hypothetical protein